MGSTDEEDTGGHTSLFWHVMARLVAVFPARYWQPWPGQTGSMLGEAALPNPSCSGHCLSFPYLCVRSGIEQVP